MIQATVWRSSTLVLELSPAIAGYHSTARLSPRLMLSPICTSACWALRGLAAASRRYCAISLPVSLRPNQVPYQKRNGNRTSSTAKPVMSRYARRPGRREGLGGVTRGPFYRGMAAMRHSLRSVPIAARLGGARQKKRRETRASLPALRNASYWKRLLGQRLLATDFFGEPSG